MDLCQRSVKVSYPRDIYRLIGTCSCVYDVYPDTTQKSPTHTKLPCVGICAFLLVYLVEKVVFFVYVKNKKNNLRGLTQWERNNMSKRASQFIKLAPRDGSRCLKPEVTMRIQVPLGSWPSWKGLWSITVQGMRPK